MTISFKGKVAVVTGGAMGIGAATARCFADLGAAVAILDRDAAVGEKTAHTIRGDGKRAEFYECDVASASQVENAMNAAASAFDGIDVLVSNAGIQRYGDVIGTTDAVWDEVMAVNLKGCFHAAKYAMPFMKKRTSGAIVVVGSVQTFTAVGNSAAYVTAKHALLGLVRAMSLDYAPDNIRVNCVCPGRSTLRCCGGRRVSIRNPEKVLATCGRMHALGRVGKPEEVANAIAFLASDWASFITGTALMVDGGMLVPTGGMGFQEGGTGAATKK